MLDDIIAELNSKVKLRVTLFLMLACSLMMLAFSNLTLALYHAKIPHHCQVSDKSLNISLPPAEKLKKSSPHPYSSCTKYANPYNHSEGTESCDNYTFYPQENEVTVVSEWDLVCDTAYLASMLSTIYFSAMLVAAPFFGFLSDRIGRRPVILISFYSYIAIGIGLYFVESLTQYIILKTMLGVICQGMWISCSSLLMEYTRNDLRGFVGAAFDMVWPVSAIILGVYAYFLHNWRELHLATIVTFSVTFFYIWLVPESVRWLITTGKAKRAQKTLARMANFNKVTTINSTDSNIQFLCQEAKANSSNESEKKNFFDLFKTTKMRLRTFILGYMWFTLGICYYGILFNTTDLNPNKYINFLLGSCLELGGVFVTLILINIMKRKSLLYLLCISASVTCIIGIVLQRYESDTVDIQLMASVFLLISKACISGAYSPLIVYGIELFPTVVRTMGQGSCLVATRVATLLAPHLTLLGDVTDKSVPFILFACLQILSSFLLCLLPETKGKTMPDTIEDVEIPNPPTAAMEMTPSKKK